MGDSVQGGYSLVALSILPFCIFIYGMLHTKAYQDIPSLVFLVGGFSIGLVLLVFGIARVGGRI